MGAVNVELLKMSALALKHFFIKSSVYQMLRKELEKLFNFSMEFLQIFFDFAGTFFEVEK